METKEESLIRREGGIVWKEDENKWFSSRTWGYVNGAKRFFFHDLEQAGVCRHSFDLSGIGETSSKFNSLKEGKEAAENLITRSENGD